MKLLPGIVRKSATWVWAWDLKMVLFSLGLYQDFYNLLPIPKLP